MSHAPIKKDSQSCNHSNLNPSKDSVCLAHPSGNLTDVALDGLFFYMYKEAYYFPHDSNAIHDEKSAFLLSKHGFVGYGIFWMFIEKMHETSDGNLKNALLEGVAFQANIDITKLTSIFNTCVNVGLFVTDGTNYWSERVKKNKEIMESKRNNRSIAGKKGMASRYHSYNNVITTPNKQKEIKGKEIQGFEEFWLKYPYKANKPSALRAWNKINPDDSLKAQMFEAIEKSTKSENWLKEDGKYIPLPASWLNGHRWEDQIVVKKKDRSFNPPLQGFPSA
jgi:hypothetical protein